MGQCGVCRGGTADAGQRELERTGDELGTRVGRTACGIEIEPTERAIASRRKPGLVADPVPGALRAHVSRISIGIGRSSVEDLKRGICNEDQDEGSRRYDEAQPDWRSAGRRSRLRLSAVASGSHLSRNDITRGE